MVERIMELESYQWILKLATEYLIKNRKFTYFQNILFLNILEIFLNIIYQLPEKIILTLQ